MNTLALTLAIAGESNLPDVVPPPPWTPALLADLRGWWPADSLGLTAGAAVSSLPSSGGITNTLAQATGTRQPLFALVDSDPDLPALDFDGVDDALVMSDLTITKGGDAVTVCLLFKMDEIDTDATLKCFVNMPGASSSQTRFFFGLENVAGASKHYGFSWRNTDAGSGNFLWSTQLADTSMHCIVATFNRAANPTHFDIWLDGTRVMNTNTGFPNGTWDNVNDAGGILGNRSTTAPNNCIDGKILDFIILDAVLSDDDREYVEGFFCWKGKIAANLPSDHPWKNGAPTV